MLGEVLGRLRGWWEVRQAPVPEEVRPRGKLGLVLDALESPGGTSIGCLMALTGWQKRTVHGALSRLRQRDFRIGHRKHGGVLVYFLEKGRR